MAGPLIKLLAKLQSVVDPRFAFGDQVVFLRARPDPVRVRIADGVSTTIILSGYGPTYCTKSGKHGE